MRFLGKHTFLILALLFFAACSHQEKKEKEKEPPFLKKQGTSMQLIVDEEPFLIRGGELGNSSFTGVKYMEDIWKKLDDMNLNTILAPVYWELIEPKEGEYDFELLDKLVKKAEDEDFKLVLLWFGSWKNSMSSHAPAWVKLNQKRFPRIKDSLGKSHEILTPFSENNLNADIAAYKALMAHVKELNKKDNTIIMMQPENEVGMLYSARDYHPLAEEAFQAQVPAELMEYMQKNKEQLVPEFAEVWKSNGSRTSGTWEEVFGTGVHTDEIFMAWYFAKYTNTVAAAGKEVYPLPMYVNAALNRPGKAPGTGYPGGGPLPHLIDVWKAASPAVDMYSPDIYFSNLEHWLDLYDRQGDQLFVPEHRLDSSTAAKALFTIGHYEALGFSPFFIESVEDADDEDLTKVYDIIDELEPLILENRGKGKIDGVLLNNEDPERKIISGDYELTFKHSYTLGWNPVAANDKWEYGAAIIIRTDSSEFYVAGTGFAMTFKNLKDTTLNVGILKAEEGEFDDGKWEVLRHLNGDQTHQGRHMRIFLGEYSLKRFELYNYE